jgi:hypothetical protein
MTSLNEAIVLVKAAGYRVSKPRSKPKRKDRVGPTFECRFADVDYTVTRMSVFIPLDNLDWDRAVRLAQAAYQSRWRRMHRVPPTVDYVPDPPAIVSAHFEQDGVMLAHYPNGRRAP